MKSRFFGKGADEEDSDSEEGEGDESDGEKFIRQSICKYQ